MDKLHVWTKVFGASTETIPTLYNILHILSPLPLVVTLFAEDDNKAFECYYEISL